jgi:predicted nucleic acid-binding protein
MRIFFDTNVIISSFITHGHVTELFEHCLLNHEIFTSDFVISELEEKLRSKFNYSEEEIKNASNFIKENFMKVDYKLPEKQICRDKDDDNIIAAACTADVDDKNDDNIIAAACAADVDCIITGDEDLLIIKKLDNIFIVSPKEFWSFEREFLKKL